MIDIYSIEVNEADAVVEPVELADAKVWANADIDFDDAFITSLVAGARQDIEKETNLALVEKTVALNVSLSKACKVKLPYGTPSNLTVTDNETEELLTEDDEYTTSGRFVKINWSGDFTVNYTVIPEVPEGLKDAIKMLVTYRYNNRGDQEKQTGLPDDIKYKVSKYREEWL